MGVMPRIVEGDLLDQDVEAIVNAWNRNLIPWWRHGLRSLAFPLIGAGVGGGAEERVLGWMRDEMARCAYAGEVRIVRYRPLK